MKTVIVWFRNDLRVHDHPALHTAANEAERVISVFVLNDAILSGRHAGSNRNRFLLESLHDLKASLQKRGGSLIIRRGDAAAELKKLADETGADEVFYTIDYSPYARQRDAAVTKTLADSKVAMRAFPGRLIIDSFQAIVTGSGTVYRVFTPFWKNWSTIDRRQVLMAPEKLKTPEKIHSIGLPALSDLTVKADLSPDVMDGGETPARQRMHDFLDGPINEYYVQNNSLAPDGNTSKLSPYLHFGCLSARELEDALPDGKGAASFDRQLAWRDFYNYILFHYPENAHQEHQERYRDYRWESVKTKGGRAKLEAWQQGKTGYPIVDAAMRELLRTGWMHNRARLIVGSFLTKDLGIDWREGEAWFMKMLQDGDEANNNGNWQWIASVGVDPAPVFRRLYNPSSQHKRYDPDNAYVRYYVPELAKLSDTQIVEPWKMSKEDQSSAKCIIGQDYPAPIVDHAEARLQALERYRR